MSQPADAERDAARKALIAAHIAREAELLSDHQCLDVKVGDAVVTITGQDGRGIDVPRRARQVLAVYRAGSVNCPTCSEKFDGLT